MRITTVFNGLEQFSKGYETSDQRFQRLHTHRAQPGAKRLHWADETLAQKAPNSWGVTKGLSRLSRWTENLAEALGDMPGLVERLARNGLSNGKSPDLVSIMAMVGAKYAVKFATISTLGLPKALASGLYGLAAILSAATVCAYTIQGHKPNPKALLPGGKSRRPSTSGQLLTPTRTVAKWMSQQKHLFIQRLLLSKWGKKSAARWLCAQLNKRDLVYRSAKQQRTDLAYMESHLSDYNRVVRGLFKFSQWSFHGVAKLMASPDKYLARALGKWVFARVAGECMGHQLAHMLTTGASFVFHFFCAPVAFVMLNAAAGVAGVALISLALAKALAWKGQGWKGERLASS